MAEAADGAIRRGRRNRLRRLRGTARGAARCAAARRALSPLMVAGLELLGHKALLNGGVLIAPARLPLAFEGVHETESDA